MKVFFSLKIVICLHPCVTKKKVPHDKRLKANERCFESKRLACGTSWDFSELPTSLPVTSCQV